MKVFEYELQFTTPAFLGNADQSGQWRTPPIKALLRQWWRVVYSADKNFSVDVDEMRRAEGLLFGNAWLSHREGNREVTDHRKSLVRVRLSQWALGNETKKTWGRQELDKKAEGVDHPEVGPIGPKLYLGYGPLIVEKVERSGRSPEYATVLKANAAIQAGESARLSIALSDDLANKFEAVLALVNLYGTVGGRSRNGWGSFVLKPLNGTPPLHEESAAFQRRWREALQLDWPHAVGADDAGKPLIWRTEVLSDWKQVMKRLAEIKIGLRTQFKPGANGAPVPEERHWLSYPITHHSVKPWGNARLPNSLRFKVRPAQNGGLRGVIFHVPCLPPADFRPDRRAIENVWQRVHQFLDKQELSRIPA